jgi:hypothetical protein
LPNSIGFSGAQLSKSIDSSSVPGEGCGSLQLTSVLVLVPAMQHTRFAGQSVCWSQLIGISGTKAGGAGQSSPPLAQNKRVPPAALSSEQHTAPLIGQLSVPHVTLGAWHTPTLAHSPVLQRESCAGARQMPVPPQVEHRPSQAELQHTPATQLPREHSSPFPHASPTERLGALQLPAVSHRLLALQT